MHMVEDYDLDDLVDVIEGSRVYIPAIYVVRGGLGVWGLESTQACLRLSMHLLQCKGAESCSNGAQQACELR